MRKSLWIALVVIIGCKQASKDIYNADKWNLGEKLNYNIEVTEIEYLKDSIIRGDKSSYKAELIVSELGDTNVLTWIIRQFVRKPDSLITEFERSISDTLMEKEEIKIVYQTNKTGQYIGIINREEIEKYIDSQWNNLFKSNQTAYRKNEKLAQKIKKISSNWSFVEAKLAKDIMVLHLIYGQPYSEVPIKSQEIISGLDNQNLPSNIKTEIIKNDDEYSYVRISSEPDSAQTANQINDFVNQFVSNNTPLKTKIKDTCLVSFNKLTCWASQIEYWRSASINDRKKLSVVSIKQAQD